MVSGSTKMPFSTRTGIYGSTQRNVNRKIVPIYYETPILYLLRLVTQSLLRHHSILVLEEINSLSRRARDLGPQRLLSD
jgi:hypothetical protein